MAAETNEKLPKDGEMLRTRHTEYEIVKLLGKGGFGAVFEVKSKDGQLFAAKCETCDVKKRVLSMDGRVLRGAVMIKSPHFCTIVDRGKVEGRFRFLVMKLVGRNLWDLRMERERQRFSLNTALKAAEQSLMSVEDLHRIGYLHRDIKPGNFAIGRPETQEHHIIYMLDFGLCRKFVGDTEAKDLRMPRQSAPFRGTTRYAAIAALKQMEQSRKDDIEAWLYMVVEWTAGQLPWRKLKGAEKEDVLRWKEAVRAGEPLEEFLSECPRREFLAIMQCVDGLLYQSIPDYSYLYFCLQHAAKSNGIKPNDPLDWDPDHPFHGPSVADRDKRIELVVKDCKENENEEEDNNDKRERKKQTV
ncbi:unnamed protein product [Bursaphelenchus xylophilus]|uniref:(pine wood nematode) hypothetical protein n=1 Tax=Bursaphelenchus xylophilus TaxID=6326 RepID=A0A1I7RKR1_BURXY|nr:unnamed protein product [Bursaphelenchus xylophilus]CAG9131142.1 unnamed protein product [Bursaphelenchus xylophilus]